MHKIKKSYKSGRREKFSEQGGTEPSPFSQPMVEVGDTTHSTTVSSGDFPLLIAYVPQWKRKVRHSNNRNAYST